MNSRLKAPVMGDDIYSPDTFQKTLGGTIEAIVFPPQTFCTSAFWNVRGRSINGEKPRCAPVASMSSVLVP